MIMIASKFWTSLGRKGVKELHEKKKMAVYCLISIYTWRAFEGRFDWPESFPSLPFKAALFN